MKPLLRGVLLAALLALGGAARADWVVQVAALADSKFLTEMRVAINKAGFPVTTEPLAQQNGPPLTRLLVGPYDTKAEAQVAAVQLAPHGWPGYVKQRTEARKPIPRPAAPQHPSPRQRPAAPLPAARAPSTSRASVPPVPVRPEPTPSAPPAPSSRPSPSLQPARPAEPPIAPSSRSSESASSQPAQPPPTGSFGRYSTRDRAFAELRYTF
ncbi:MAG: SPOR domain-containing protein [Thermoanaerobaculia bacterium]|nr:SPOR domain-containing protein [Thermoanaerobaculia bacterium]